MRLITIVVALVACSPLGVSGGDTNAVTQESASEQLQQAETEMAEAKEALATINVELRSQTVDREEELKAGPRGNLRGTNNLARSAVPPPDDNVVDELEVERAEEQAKEALAENKFEEAITEMAKFFEQMEKRPAVMRARSNELDQEQEEEDSQAAEP